MKKIFLIVLYSISIIPVYSQTDSTASDSLLLLQIQNQLKIPESTNSIPSRSSISANPDISVIGDFRANYQSNYTRHFNANLNETEISFQSVVDPYVRADFFVSLSRDQETGAFDVGIEEGYLTTLSLPAHLQLKAGKFKQMLGRINFLHPHALPFIDMPNAFVRFFGEEGLNDAGLSLSWLLPNNSFFQELTVEITDGPHESPSFIRSSGNNFIGLAHLKNFWDLTNNATLEFGLTGISGPNVSNKITSIAAADLTYKWKPVKFNTYKSVTFQNEFYYSHTPYLTKSVNSIGFYSMLLMQISKRTFLTGRYDYTNKPTSNKFVEEAGSLTVGWYLTEFQKIELQVKNTSANSEEIENNFKKNFNQAFIRWIFVIGLHGAHKY